MTTIVSPLASGASLGRVDQGLDVTQADPFKAIAAGIITYVDPNFYKGTPAVYEKLDQPITVNGRTYSEVYYSETPALIAAGKRVSAGTPVTAGGSAELGFAADNLPAAHTTYVEGVPTPAGQDFRDLLTGTSQNTNGGGGGILGTIEKGAGTPLDIISGGLSGSLGVPSFIPSASSLAGDAGSLLGLNPTKWVKELTDWATKQFTVGFLYLFLTLAAFGLLAIALRRAAPGATSSVGRAARDTALAVAA